MAISNKILFIIAFQIILTTISYGQSPSLGTVCAESSHKYGVDGYSGSSYIWAVEDGGIIVNGDGTDSIFVNWGYNKGTFKMEVVEVSSAGCIGAPVVAYTTVQAPEVDLGFDFYEICEGDSAVFDASGAYDGVPTYLWHNGSTASTYVADTTEDIWVLVTDALGCQRYDSIEFIAHTNPEVNLGNDTILCDVEIPYELDAGDFAAYEWETNKVDFIGNPVYIYANYEATDTVQVTITDFNDCQDSDTLLIFPCNVAKLFENRNNTFTPNGDEINDKWYILNDGQMKQFPDAVLEVFDRWGRLVYHTTDVDGNPWDGTSKGKDMPMDAYFYVLDLNYANFEALSGTVNLIR